MKAKLRRGKEYRKQRAAKHHKINKIDPFYKGSQQPETPVTEKKNAKKNRAPKKNDEALSQTASTSTAQFNEDGLLAKREWKHLPFKMRLLMEEMSKQNKQQEKKNQAPPQKQVKQVVVETAPIPIATPNAAQQATTTTTTTTTEVLTKAQRKLVNQIKEDAEHAKTRRHIRNKLFWKLKKERDQVKGMQKTLKKSVKSVQQMEQDDESNENNDNDEDGEFKLDVDTTDLDLDFAKYQDSVKFGEQAYQPPDLEQAKERLAKLQKQQANKKK